MLAKRIIPCLDVKDGRVVKGINFVKLRDAGDPVENSKIYEEQGADELTFLDITASSERRNIILDVVERTASEVFMPLTVGGGVRTLSDIRDLLNAGADKVSINTAAVKDANLVKKATERFGTQCIVVAIDGKRVERTGGAEDHSSFWEVWGIKVIVFMGIMAPWSQTSKGGGCNLPLSLCRRRSCRPGRIEGVLAG